MWIFPDKHWGVCLNPWLTAGSHGTPSVITPLQYSWMCYSSRKQGDLKVLSIYICYGWIVCEKIWSLADVNLVDKHWGPSIHGWWQWATSVSTLLHFHILEYVIFYQRQGNLEELSFHICYGWSVTTSLTFSVTPIHTLHIFCERKRERSTCYCCRRVSTSFGDFASPEASPSVQWRFVAGLWNQSLSRD